MKTGILLFLGILAVVIGRAVWLHPPDDAGQRRMALQRTWARAPKIMIPGAAFEAAARAALEKTQPALSEEQRSRLIEKLDLWAKGLHSGSYADFIAFREPERYVFNAQQVAFVSTQLHGDPRGLDGLSDAERAQALFRYFNTLVFDSVSSGSITVTVRTADAAWTKPSSGLNPFAYYPTGMLRLHTSSPFQYLTDPAQVMREHGRVVWATFCGAFYSRQIAGQAVPVQIALYWSPEAREWKPAECYLCGTRQPRQEGPEPVLYF